MRITFHFVRTLLRALRTLWLSARPAPARAALAGAGRVSVPIESKPRGGLVPFCAVTHGKVKALPPPYALRGAAAVGLCCPLHAAAGPT